MSDEKALFAAIMAKPDEDVPRLMYADWLEEHGDDAQLARAEFIRLQVELARGGLSDRQRGAAARRCEVLEREHAETWLASFRTACGKEEVEHVFRRGFVSDVSGMQTLPSRFAAIAAACPVQRIDFDFDWVKNTKRASPAMAKCKALARLRWMECRRFPADFAKEVLASPHLTGLHTVYLQWGWLSQGAKLVSRSPVARNLRHLWVWGARESATVFSAGLGAILNAEWPSLTQLRLDNLSLGEDNMLKVVREAAERKWQAVHVEDYSITQNGAKTAVELALASQLPSVSIARDCDLDEPPEPVPDGVKTLGLRAFYPNGTALVQWIVRNVPAGRFNRLVLRQSQLGVTAARALVKWPGLAHLTELDLRANQFGDDGAKVLAESPHLENVKLIRFANNHLSQEGKDVMNKRFARRVRIAM